MATNLGTLGSLAIDVGANLARFESDMGRADRIAQQRMQSIQKTVNRGVAVIAAASAAVATAAGVAVKRAIDRAAELDDLSQKVGASTEALSRLRFGAQIEGVEDLTGALVKLSKNIVEGKDKSSEAGKAFAALGVDVTDAAGKVRSTDLILRDVAAAFAGAEDGAAKAAIAQALFGKSGADLIPFLNKGAEGLDKYAQLADKLGLTISGSTAAAADEFNNQLFIAQKAVEGLANRALPLLLPKLSSLTGQFVDYTTSAAGSKEATEALEEAVRGLAIGAAVVGESIFGVIKLARALGGSFQVVAADVTVAANALNAGLLLGLNSNFNEVLKASLQERNKIAAEANARYVDLWNYNGTAVSDAIRKAFDKQSEAVKQIDAFNDPLSAFGSIALPDIKLNIDFSAAEKAEVAVHKLRKAVSEYDAVLDLHQGLAAEEADRAKASEEIQRIARSYDQARLSAQAFLDTQARALSRQLDDIGMGPAARRFSAGRNQIDEQFLSHRSTLSNQLTAGQIPADQYEQQLKIIEDFHGSALRQWDDYFARIEERQADFTLGFQDALLSYVDSTRNVGATLGSDFVGAIDNATNATANLASKFLLFGEGGKEEIRQIASTLAQDLLSSLIKVGIQMGTNFLIGQALGTAGLAATAAQASAAAALWTPAAFAASVATFGAAGAAGLAAYTAGLGSAQVATLAAAVAGGRKFGGPVGAGKMYEVNEGGSPELLRTGGKTMLMMGRADGYVSPATPNRVQFNAGAGAAAAPVVKIRNIYAFDKSVQRDFMTSAEGEEIYLNWAARNAGTLRGLLGGS